MTEANCDRPLFLFGHHNREEEEEEKLVRQFL